MTNLEHILSFSFALFSLGLVGVLVKKNLLMVLLCLEIMLNSAAFLIISVSSLLKKADGHVMFFFLLVVAAAEVAIGLSILFRYHELHQSLDIDKANNSKV